MGNSCPRDNSLESTDENKIASICRHFVNLKKGQLPIVYSEKYNIKFFSIENYHPFDAHKWGRIFEMLVEEKVIKKTSIIKPEEISEKELSFVHSKDYLYKLRWSWKVASVMELPQLSFFCHFLLDRKILRPMRYQTAGTLTAARLALYHGWSINIGGGFHHCCSEDGMGSCPYADITLAIRVLQRYKLITKAMIIDLDAHQGNGHERDFENDPNVYIVDAYNKNNFPNDEEAKKSIKRKIELKSNMQDKEYLNLITRHIKAALREFKPSLIIYNAGTDILEGDALGELSISEKGIIQRDEIVFFEAQKYRYPVVMVTSGGYHRSSARVVAKSIRNLGKMNLIDLHHIDIPNCCRAFIP